MAATIEGSSDLGVRIGFVGTYPPRRCGIATFTADLSTAIGACGPGAASPIIVAVSDAVDQYEYPPGVAYEVRQGVKADYARAAEVINYSDVGLVSVQHEHGIFGGDDGAYILDFLGVLRAPAVATFHTVLKRPSDSQRSVVRSVSRLCARVVVMSELAARLLEESYGLARSKIRVIPHGIPDLAQRRPERLKAKFGVAGRRMLLTFGLLGPNKGIETAIRALPPLVAAYPDIVYFVVGATHPHVRQRHGEAYRTFLEREAERLGVRDHVVFRDQFVSNDELSTFLQAADIYLCPYRSEAQVTSGALSYAMGAGAAVVSTPYWHAQELLADGRGHLFPFDDHAALSTILASLLASPEELERSGRAAFDLTRSMVWPAIGRSYLELANSVLEEAPSRRPADRPTRASSLPELRLDHLLRLTDDTGVIQHATFTVPARQSGYCVDDNARALIVALQADRIGGDARTKALVTKTLAYLHHSQNESGDFTNLMSYERVLTPGSFSEDCFGRAVWALGTTVDLAIDDGQRQLARRMLDRALPHALELGPRGTATTMLGLVSALSGDPSNTGARDTIGACARKLLASYARESSPEWQWFEPAITYDNALLPLALFRAYPITREEATLRVARESLDFLQRASFTRGHLALVGNGGWHRRGHRPPAADEQAIDAAAFVLAFRGAWLVTGEHRYLARMRESFAWFLGSNRLREPLYDSATAGCRDGLGATEINRNEGAESTVCFLLALQEMLELAAEALEPPVRRDEAVA